MDYATPADLAGYLDNLLSRYGKVRPLPTKYVKLDRAQFKLGEDWYNALFHLGGVPQMARMGPGLSLAHDICMCGIGPSTADQAIKALAKINTGVLSAARLALRYSEFAHIKWGLETWEIGQLPGESNESFRLREKDSRMVISTRQGYDRFLGSLIWRAIKAG